MRDLEAWLRGPETLFRDTGRASWLPEGVPGHGENRPRLAKNEFTRCLQGRRGVRLTLWDGEYRLGNSPDQAARGTLRMPVVSGNGV